MQTVTVRNITSKPIPGPLSLVLDDLSENALLVNATDYTLYLEPLFSPCINVDVGSDQVLSPGEKATVILRFVNLSKTAIHYRVRVLAGAGPR